MKDSLNLSLNKVHILLNAVVNVFSELSWFIFFQFFNYFFVSMFCFPQQFILLLFEHSWMWILFLWTYYYRKKVEEKELMKKRQKILGMSD